MMMEACKRREQNLGFFTGAQQQHTHIYVYSSVELVWIDNPHPVHTPVPRVLWCCVDVTGQPFLRRVQV